MENVEKIDRFKEECIKQLEIYNTRWAETVNPMKRVENWPFNLFIGMIGALSGLKLEVSGIIKYKVYTIITVHITPDVETGALFITNISIPTSIAQNVAYCTQMMLVIQDIERNKIEPEVVD